MKLNCGPTRGERVAFKKTWHRWFAWYPVRVGSRERRWLETVERKGSFAGSLMFCYWVWQYRPIGEQAEAKRGEA